MNQIYMGFAMVDMITFLSNCIYTFTSLFSYLYGAFYFELH